MKKKKNTKKRELDWLDRYKQRPLGSFVIYRLGFSQKFLRMLKPEEAMESLRVQTVREKSRIERELESNGQHRYNWYYRQTVGSAYSECRRYIRMTHSKTFSKDKLYRTRSSICGDAKAPDWGYGAWRHVPKNTLVSYVGRTLLDEPLFMPISGRLAGTGQYIRFNFSSIHRVTEVEDHEIS